MQNTINQRIKFLLDTLNLSARSFGRAIGVAENSTQNYLEPRLAMPKADYLEKILRHFGSINPRWLVTGEGEPFASDSSADYQIQSQNQENNQGNIFNNKGDAKLTVEDCKQQLHHCQALLASQEKHVTQLASQLADKDEIIQLLKANQPKL